MGIQHSASVSVQNFEELVGIRSERRNDKRVFKDWTWKEYRKKNFSTQCHHPAYLKKWAPKGADTCNGILWISVKLSCNFWLTVENEYKPFPSGGPKNFIVAFESLQLN